MDPSGTVWQRYFAELKRRKVFRVMAVYGIVGWAVLQAMDLAVPALLLPEWSYRLVAVLLLAGFPVAAVLAWAFEIGPEGVRRTGPATAGEIDAILAAPASRRWPSGLLALAGIVALVAGAWYAGRHSAEGESEEAARSGDPGSASIAVLPCRNAAADADQEYLSDGIAEDLSSLLSHVPGLRVTSFRSSFAFKNRGALGTRAIADSLQVDHLLDCSVQKSGDRVRVSAQLIEARADATLWSERWERALDDVFAIQDEITAEVAEQLEVQLLGPAPRAVRADTLAYELLLQARMARGLRSPDEMARSDSLLLRAVEVDPTYALAHAELAANLLESAARGYVEDGYRLAREAAYRALAIDPDLAVAHARLAAIESAERADMATAAGHLNRAFALDPTDLGTLEQAGDLLVNLGRPEQAIEVMRHVVERDPLNPEAYFHLGRAYWAADRPEEALGAFRKSSELVDPEGTSGSVGFALVAVGRPDEALESFRALPEGAVRLWGLAAAYHALGRDRESDEAVAALIACCERDWSYNVAWIHATRGDADAAFEWLEKAVRYGDAGLTQIRSSRVFDALHDDPRWIPFLEKLGLAPEQLDAIELHLPPLD